MKKTLIPLLKVTFTLICFFISYYNVSAQGLGVNTTGVAADPSAMLDVSGTNSGVLINRMTSAQRNAIPNPAEGLVIFNTDSKCFNFFRNNTWFELCGNCIGPPAPVAGSNSPVCEGSTLNLTATTVPQATYYWTGPNGFTSTAQNPVLSNVTLQAGGVYTVYSVLSCNSQPATTTVVVNSGPASTFTANPVMPIVGQACVFSPTLTGANYNWTFQSGSPATSTAQNPSVTWSTTGTYSVSLTVTQNGCSSTTNSSISINTCYNHSQSQTFSYTGADQTWTVPSGTCSITVEAFGAQGGTSFAGAIGGKGAYIKGTFTVASGDVITIKAGGKGVNGTGGSLHGGGGGGGSFVINGGNILLIAAGGGGGSYSSSSCVGQPGNASTTGGAGGYYSVTVGSGGFSDNGQGGGCGSGGGGWNSAGTGNNWCTGGQAAGGAGGVSQYTGHGGWAGGGASYHGGGGGGGYTGGSGGNYTIGGGGGGSINNGTSQTNTADYQTGNGSVIIAW
ncbi:MAG: PKD domain-containing protein [Bacteroidota bacterium]